MYKGQATESTVVSNESLEVVNKFHYLGDVLDVDGTSVYIAKVSRYVSRC